MLNAIWVALILIAILCGALTGRMEAVTQQSVMSAKAGVTLALGLVGIMSFWLGMMHIAREAGLLRWIARKIRPVMTRLFPDVPADHPAMSSMIMNMSANMLGLGNAATPFGLKAMIQLDSLNPHKGTASNSMALFLAINTSNVAILPTGVIAIRAAMGSTNPTGILFTTFFATVCSTTAAIIVAKLLQRLPRYSLPSIEDKALGAQKDESNSLSKVKENGDDSPSEKNDDDNTEKAPEEQDIQVDVGPKEELETPAWAKWLQLAFWGTLLLAAVLHIVRANLSALTIYMESATWSTQSPLDLMAFSPISYFSLSKDLLSFWLLPSLIAALLLYGISKGVKVYAALVEGAKEGFDIAIRIIPFLVAILVAIGMFRASGALDILINGIAPLVEWMGMPSEALPMALMRPLSGSGAFGIMADTMQAHGPDSLIGYMVSTFQGSTETTFYVIAVYFGVAQIKGVRHTLAACLVADTVGIIAAVWICIMMFG